MRELDKERWANEMRRQLSPDPNISKEVDLSDVPSKYTKYIEIFRQVLGIPHLRDTITVPSSSVMGLNPVAKKQEARPK